MKDQLLNAGESMFNAIFNHFGSLDKIPNEIASEMNEWVNACLELDLDRQFLENARKK